MRPLTHDQARHLLMSPPARLSPDSREALTAHLAGCVECQAHADGLRPLEANVAHTLHARWDGTGPAANLPVRVVSRFTGETMQKHVWPGGRLASLGTFLVFVTVVGAAILLAVRLASPGSVPGGGQPPTATLEPGPVLVTTVPEATPSGVATPLDVDARELCLSLYEDVNGNGIRDPGEGLIAGGTMFVIESASDRTKAAFKTDGVLDPYCISDLISGQYHISVSLPAGYQATTRLRWDLSLSPVSTTQLEVGAHLAPPSPAPPTQPAPILLMSGEPFTLEPNMIAFTSSVDGDYEIYLANQDASRLVQLTQNDVSDFEPTWSPDGQKIAYVTFALEQPPQIFVIDLQLAAGGAAGLAVRQISHNAVQYDRYFGLRWSADGTRLSITHWKTGEGSQADYVLVDGSGQGLIRPGYSGNVWSAVWSPVGSHLAVTADDGLYIVQSDGAEAQLMPALNGLSDHVSWSHDGQWLAINRFMESNTSTDGYVNELYVLPVDAGEPKYLADIGTSGVFRWSPVDDRLAYYMYHGEVTATETVTADINIIDPGTSVNTVVAQASKSGGIEALVWSPDGQYLLFSGEGNSNCWLKTGLYLLDLAHDESHFIRCTTPGGGLARWSADSQWFALNGQRDLSGSAPPNSAFIVSLETALQSRDEFILLVDGGRSQFEEVRFEWRPAASP
jgi:Tol biopolymer transport system component